MAQSKLLRVLGDLAPVSYRAAYLAVADPRELIELHESGLAGRTGCRRLVVTGARSRRNRLNVEAVSSVRQVLRSVEPIGLLISDDPKHATFASPTILIGTLGSLESRLPPTFTILRSRAFEIALNFQPPLVWEKIERHQVKVIRDGTPRWSDPPILHGQKLRRWTSHRPPLKNVLELAADHPAVVEGRTIFPSRVFDAADVGRVLVPGESSRKIGGYISKGAWKGSRIFTLSLEERASCPRACTHWRSCYTNHMPFTKRLRHGPTLVARIEQELVELTERHPEGVVIRTHISGDFWSTGYVRQWARWLRRFSNLRVFGYTAYPPRSRIGSEIRAVTDRYWSRFAIRFSNSTLETRAANTIHYQPLQPVVPEGIVCPAQTAKTETCGTCALCWGSERNIAFIAH
jgi:hypothetical protein